jgi:hypothetical protein
MLRKGPLSPNAEEALNLLSLPLPPTKPTIELAAQTFLECDVGARGEGSVIIRSGQLGAFVVSRSRGSAWVDAYWRESEEDARHVVDVTGN